MFKSVPLADRFWANVNKSDGCWNWTACTQLGYGTIYACGHKSKRLWAHRVSWELHHGPVPDGLFVLHHCDNPSCVRPDHLFLGTTFDNVHDCMSKGRWPEAIRGESHANAKLTDDEVREIRSRYSTKDTSCTRLAAQYGVSRSLIWLIVRRMRWQHIE